VIRQAGCPSCDHGGDEVSARSARSAAELAIAIARDGGLHPDQSFASGLRGSWSAPSVGSSISIADKLGSGSRPRKAR
jgi:hypothetical protein